MDIIVIGGSGLYDMEELMEKQEITVENEYGTVHVVIGKIDNKEVGFIARHGKKHSVPPSMVNYRANIKAVEGLGARYVIATSAVGSLNEKMKPGDFVLLDQFIDFTKNRIYTFFEDEVRHTDVTEPYCPKLRATILKAGKNLNLKIHPEGTYVCTEGPRYETPAEIRAFKMLGADVVGMTQVPEVVLANEIGLCYASIAIITNYAAGISKEKLTHEEVMDVMNRRLPELKKLIIETIRVLD